MGNKAEAAAGSGAGTSAGREEPIVVAIKMDKTTIIVSSVVGSLGVLSAILGFAAEAAKFTDCASSLGLAIAATIFLMMAQVTVAAVGGCCGCCKSRAVPSETKRIVGVFAGAGVLVLVATGLGITSFIMLRMHPQAGEAAAGRAAPRDYDDDEPTPIGTPIDIHGFRPPMPPNPQVPEPLPNYPPPPYSPAPAPAPAPAEGNGNQLAPDQQLAPHPQGHAQIEAPAAAGLEEPAAVLAIKMDKTTIIVSAVVGSLGLLSAILGFAAEGAKRTKAMIIYVFNFQRCELDLYDLYYSSNSSSAAVGLGVCGAILLVITQVTVAAIGGCCGCCKSRAIPSETKRIVGVVCAVFSWITAVIAFVLFLDGAIVESNCVLVRGGFFASAGVLTLITTALGMTSYFMLRAQPDEPAAPAARRPPGPAGGDEPTPIVGVPTAVPAGFPPPVSSPNPLLVPVPAAQAPPNQQFAHPATSQAPPHARFADAAVPAPAPAAAQGYGSQASNQQHFPANPRGRTTVVAIKMDKTTIIVSVVVGSLGLLSAILGFAAEGSKLTVTVTAVGGCCGCCKSRAIPSETKRIVGVVCAVISWIAAVIAFVMFLDAGIVASECFIVREGFFAGAGVLALIATALGLTSYIVLRPQPDAAAGRGEPTPIGIPMDAVPGYPPRPPHPPPQQGYHTHHGIVITAHISVVIATVQSTNKSTITDQTTVIVSAVAASLGALSAILGFAADAAKHSDCASALGMAVAASIFLMMAKVTVAAGGGCRESRAVVPSATKRTVAVACAAISWIATVIAFVMFLDTGGISVVHGSSSRSAAAELGICAAIFLMITHVAMAAAGCCCRSFCIPSETARVVCAITSWIVPVIVFVLLLHAAVEESDCDKIHKGVYAGAGVLVLVSTVLGITSYLMLRTRPEPTPPIVVPMVIAFQPVYPNPLLVPVPVQAPPPNQAFAHPATLPPQGGWYGQAPNQQFAAPAPAQGYGWQAPNQQHFPCAGVVP
uniref:Uncharacterized protein n=1 Tax=Oryza nivara TaxID=4536 RepID=A0A0E0HEY6_ORYNI